MLKRYSRPEMAQIWTEENKFRRWVSVEVAVLFAKKECGLINFKYPKMMCELTDSIKINVDEINRIEREETKHDVIAFLMHTSPQLPEELRPHWHRGMTSYDIVDTALSVMMTESVQVLSANLETLMDEIGVKAKKYQYVPQIGRTHGVHAEPITFGVRLANWYDELARHAIRLIDLEKLVSVGKISGAVGMYSLDPKIEKFACQFLNLTPIVATQIISRDIIAQYLSTLAIIGGTIEKIATNIRLMQRTEVREVQEFFDKNQRGSSAMPHKKNPISSENLCGLARTLRGYAMTGFENQNSWEERDLCNSGSERIIIPDATILLDYMIARLAGVIKKLLVYPEKMKENLALTKGLIFSQDVQMLVAEKSNLPREEAYGIVKDIAMACWDDKKDFLQALLENAEVMKYVTEDELKSCFDIDEKIKHVDTIFEKVFRS